MVKMRLESDSIGTLEVPADAYYGVQSLRGSMNFRITGYRLHEKQIVMLAALKKASAYANHRAGILKRKICDAIVQACDEIMAGKFHDQFIVDPIQGGAGTSANMNANEVIANRAIEILGGEKGDYSIVHPNDHVNMSQSTNDIYPSSGKLAALALLSDLLAKLHQLDGVLMDKAAEFDHVLKVGRTQMQDAVPIRLGQEFHSYSSAIKRDLQRISRVRDQISMLNMGATAIGTAINVPASYLDDIARDVSDATGIAVTNNIDLVDGTQNLDGIVAVSGTLKACAVTLSKMSNDLRLMSSGPKTGFAEINLPAMQNGSSIMPGKVNPVIPEVVSQVAYAVIGNDVTITMCAEAGQLELNAFEPVAFYRLFESITAMTGAIDTLINNCLLGITANEDRCRYLLDHSVCTVTALVPHIGYKHAATIAKTALKTGKTIRELVLEEGIMDEAKLDDVLDPYHLTVPGAGLK